ncbi:hypothetical protein CLAIMM_02079 [Cladophialophora immunda]|nr:hypothetical protein CLAIMM_02079 [Cladophialophora immunda]
MKVLVTGGTGFLAAHCIDQLLQRGHTVVFTARSVEKAQRVLHNHCSTPSDTLGYVIVKDIAEEAAFDDAVQSEPPFDAVLHTASPFYLNITDPKELLDPAILGTTGLLHSINRLAPAVRRVVVTSSFASMMSPARHPKTYDETSWNPITRDEAALNAANAYRASKTLAERAAWDFVDREKPNFDIATINPPLVLGPVTHGITSLDGVNTSNERILGMTEGKYRHSLPPSLGVYLWADVRDVALAHVRAAEVPEAGGRRFLVAADTYLTNADIARVIKESFPHLADLLPSKLESDMPADVYGYDNSQSKAILELDYRKLDDCVVDTVKSLLAVQG